MPDDDLSLVPIDDEADRPLAPQDPFDPNVPTVHLICSACRLRFYAPEKYIGLWTCCPDCGKRNEIRKVDPKFKYEVELSDDGGYGVRGLDAGTQKARQMPRVDYSAIGDNKPVVLPKEERVFDDTPQKMEGFVSNLLLSKEEKERIAEIKRRKAEITAELYDIKQAARDGTLEKHLEEKARKEAATTPVTTTPVTNTPVTNTPVTNTPGKPDAARRDAAVSPSPPSLPSRAVRSLAPPPLPPKNDTAGKAVPVTSVISPATAPPVLLQTPTTPTPPAVPTGTVPLSGSGPTPSRSGVKALQNAERRPADESAWRFFFAPFFAAHNRRRFTALLVFGLLGHLFGETARSVVHMVLLETGEPGQMIGGMGQAVFFFSFLPGAFFEILWIGILFLFAVSIYLETERGSRTITHWLPFNINDGLSYLFWTFLFMFLSGIPGYLFWFFSIASIRFSDSPVIDLFCRIASQALAVGFSIFLTFPLLFLCVIESETFWGGLPRKTLQSIRNRPAHWLCFYLLSMPIVAGMLFAVLAPVAANTLFGDSWFFQSFLYFPAVAVWVAVTMSFLPLFYFRLLGRLGARIREE